MQGEYINFLSALSTFKSDLVQSDMDIQTKMEALTLLQQLEILLVRKGNQDPKDIINEKPVKPIWRMNHDKVKP